MGEIIRSDSGLTKRGFSGGVIEELLTGRVRIQGGSRKTDGTRTSGSHVPKENDHERAGEDFPKEKHEENDEVGVG